MNMRSVCVCLAFAVVQLPAADRELNVAAEISVSQEADTAWNNFIKQADASHRDGRLPDAEASAKRALALAKRFPRSDPRVAASYYLLASVYRSWGKCAESRSNYGRAVTLILKQPDAKPKYVFNAIVGLIGEATECDDVAVAQKLYRTHAAALQRLRSSPSDDAKILSLQGCIARGRKRYAEAEDYYRRAIEILEGSGAPPSYMAELRSSRAVMLSLLKRHTEALTEALSSIALLESISPRYLTLPSALNNAACTLAQLGRKAESERMYQRALELAKELYGEDNRNTARIMINYAGLLRDNKETPAAETLRKNGVEAYRRSLVHDSQTVDVEDLRK